MNAKQTTLICAAGLLALAGFVPICWMAGSSLSVNGGLSTINYVRVLGNANTWLLFRNSLILAALTTLTAGLLGILLGVTIAKTDLPLRRFFAFVFSLPLLFPSYVLAMGWFEVLGRGGVLARWLGPRYGELTSAWFFTMHGGVLVLAPAFLPIALLLTIAYVRSVNPRLEEAGRLATGWPDVLRKITLPLIAPGTVLALVLVFLLTMGEFGAPSFLRLRVFPVASFTQSSAFYNYGAASAATMPLLLCVVGGLIIIRRITGQRAYSFRWGGDARTAQVALGRLRALVFLIVCSLAILAVLVPLAALIWRGFSRAALAEALQRAGDSALRSIVYAALAASIVSTIGFFLGYIVHTRAFRRWSWSVDALGLFLFTLPGTVIGISMIAIWNRPSTNWIYATPAMLLVAFIAQYAALGMRITSAGLSQLSPSFEEAAELAGAGWFRRVFSILAPVLRPVLFTSWAVVFVFCLRDVPLPLLLAPPGQDTLTARTMTLMANGTQELVAALGILAVLLPTVPLAAFAVVRGAWKVLA